MLMIMEPGDYAGPGPTGPIEGHWLIMTPNGYSGRLSPHVHQITEHADGTITVSPSIKITAPQKNGPGYELWHGYLTQGIWREA